MIAEEYLGRSRLFRRLEGRPQDNSSSSTRRFSSRTSSLATARGDA